MTTETAREFHLGDILSITTGRLVSPSHIGGVYKILNYMTDDNLMTHQLGRAMDQCRPFVFQQHPQLAEIVVPEDLVDRVKPWLREQVKRYGVRLPIIPIPASERVHRNPIDELLEMRPDANIMPVVVLHDD